MKISSEQWRAAWFQLLQSLHKYCTRSQTVCAGTHAHTYTHVHPHTHTYTHTTTLLASVWRRAQLDQPQSLALPHWLSSFCRPAEVKHHLLAGFGGFLITSECSVQANHYCWKYYAFSGSIKGITAWLHVMPIEPQCKCCLSVSGVFTPDYENNSFHLGEYDLNPPNCILFKVRQTRWDAERVTLSVRFTGKNCCFGGELPSGWHKSPVKCNCFRLTLCKSMHVRTHKRTHDWNAVLAPRL